MARPHSIEAGHLKQRVGLLGVVMFGAGTAIGVSIFSVLSPAAKAAGSGLLVAIAIAIVPMILFAAVYSFMASALPKSGASYEWPRRFLHPSVGFLVSWLRILSNVGALVVLSLVLVNYLSAVIVLPLRPTMAIVLSAIFLLNFFGVSVAARAQTFLMLLLLSALTIFAVSGVPMISWTTIGSPLAVGWPAILASVPLLISLFLGIETAAEIGEEIRDPQRNIPRGISLAVLLTAVVYLIIATTALGLVGPERLATSAAPLLDAAKVCLGSWAAPLILGAACISILKTLNSTTLVFSRAIFAMGRAGALPRAVARIHPRFGTPYVALGLCYVATMLGLFMPSELTFLLLAVNIPTILKYMCSSLSAVRVADRYPNIWARAIFRPKRSTVAILGWLGVAAGLVLLVAGLGADWRPYALIGIWAVIGFVYWFAVARRFENPVEDLAP